MDGRETDAARAHLAALGTGSRGDRLDFRLVVRLLLRCVHLLRPVRRHVAALFGALVGLAIVFVPLGVLLFDAFWTRALEGQPLLPLEARVLGLDPVAAVAVDALPLELRRQVLLRTVLLGGVAGVLVTPLVMALYYYQMWILQRVNQHLRVTLLERLQALSLRFHAESRVGDAIYRMVQDSAMVTQLIEVLFLTPAYTPRPLPLQRRRGGALRPAARAAPRRPAAALPRPRALVLAPAARALPQGARGERARSPPASRRSSPASASSRPTAPRSPSRRASRRRARAAFDAAFDARSLLASFLVLLFEVTGVALALAGAVAALRTRRGDGIARRGIRLQRLEPRALQLREDPLRRRRRPAPRALPHLGPHAGHRDRPRPRVRGARPRAGGARRGRRDRPPADPPGRPLQRRVLPLRPARARRSRAWTSRPASGA